ncbi:hypothetical protein AU190_05770 [Mycolicibacterium acapulense]|nr:hypothetical protein AU190_05770 [Mycolicibacterium acapulense]
MTTIGWGFWRLNRTDDGSLQWLALTRPQARATIDRFTVWTLIPGRRLFLANWIVTEDHRREYETGVWIHQDIDVDKAPEIAVESRSFLPKGLTGYRGRIRCLMLDKIDRHPRRQDSWCTGRSSLERSALIRRLRALAW